VHVPIDRAVVDAKLLGDLFGTCSIKQEQHDLALAPTESGESAGGMPSGDSVGSRRHSHQMPPHRIA
jgi:hypothetical protein